MLNEETEYIVEYHLCSDCTHSMSVPSSSDLSNWELACTKRCKDLNRDGGITSCRLFEEKEES